MSGSSFRCTVFPIVSAVVFSPSELISARLTLQALAETFLSFPSSQVVNERHMRCLARPGGAIRDDSWLLSAQFDARLGWLGRRAGRSHWGLWCFRANGRPSGPESGPVCRGPIGSGPWVSRGSFTAEPRPTATDFAGRLSNSSHMPLGLSRDIVRGLQRKAKLPPLSAGVVEDELTEIGLANGDALRLALPARECFRRVLSTETVTDRKPDQQGK